MKLDYIDIVSIGKKIKYLREANDMSQEDLANLLYVSRQAISKWEKGLTLPDIINIVRLSQIFNVDINYLLGLKK